MAEQVQATLDRMVEPLADLQARGIFSADEIAQTVERRRQQEYLLKRTAIRREDFLQYIQDETRLEKLRELRTKRIRRKQQHKQGPNDDPSPGDSHIRKHVHSLWNRILQKFRSDSSLYLEYGDYLKQTQAHDRLGRLYARAVQLFPRQGDWWIQAAAHEYFVLGSMQNARVLLQRGLRMSEDKKLWLQFFLLELHFVQKLAGRKKILDEEEGKEGTEASDASKDPYRLAQLVHDNAIQSTADSTELRVSFWYHCTEFPDTSALRQHIFSRMEQDYCNEDVTTWLSLADSLVQNQRSQAEEEGETDERHSEDDMSLTLLRRAVTKFDNVEVRTKVAVFLEEHQEDYIMCGVSEEAMGLLKGVISKTREMKESSDELWPLQVRVAMREEQYESALQVLQPVLDKNKSKTTVWLAVAEVYLAMEDIDKVGQILVQARASVPMVPCDDYIHLMLEAFGFLLSTDDPDVSRTFNRLWLLSEGQSETLRLPSPIFGLHSVLQGAVTYLQNLVDMKEQNAARALYRKLLLSNQPRIKDEMDVDLYHQLTQAALQMERDCLPGSRDKIDLLLKKAILVFEETKFKENYCRQRDEFRYRLAPAKPRIRAFQVPRYDASSPSFSAKSVIDSFHQWKVVHLTNVRGNNFFTWHRVAELFQGLDDKDKESLCIERNEIADISSFLTASKDSENAAYCSFMIQHDTSALQSLKKQLTACQDLHSLWNESDVIWIFFARNDIDNLAMQGRPEHTDSISHDGTWHYQLSGSKQWKIRPTDALIEEQPLLDSQRELHTCVTCAENDMFIVNTKLWFHQTFIPGQNNPSVSFARDFCFSSAEMDDTMTNAYGVYATATIERGHLVFTEAQMPDCELHRSHTHYNCSRVALDSGEQAVVATRDIQPGEFFVLSHSDDESTD